MILNSEQYQSELAKDKPKILKAQIEQAKREKNKIWEPVPNSIGNLKRLKK